MCTEKISTEELWTIGSVIKMLRDEQGITGAELSYGLCSSTTLSRIEASEREMNVIFYRLLFGRLGYHPDKFELYGGKEEYAQYEQREFMENLKKEESYEQLEKELERYKEVWKADIEKDILQRQFVSSMEGILCFQKRDYKNSVKLLQKAVECTIPEWDDKWVEKAVLGEEELVLMEMLAAALEADGSLGRTFLIRKNIISYLERRPTGCTQMLHIYTEMLIKLVPVLLEQKNIGQAYAWCEKGLKALADNGRIYHWGALLYWKGRCLEEMYHMGGAELSEMKSVYIRGFYICRMLGKPEMAEDIRLRMDKEVPGWESIRLETL